MHKLKDLFDIAKLQELVDNLSALTGLACAINDDQDNQIVVSGWQTICSMFHRMSEKSEKICRMSNQKMQLKLKSGKSTAEVCLNGLVDFALPIIIQEQYLGAFYIGQYFREAPDLAFYKKQAKKFGFDTDKYIDAVNSVPILNTEQEAKICKYCESLINLLFNLGLSKFTEIESNKKLTAYNTELVRNVEQLESLNAEYEETREQLSESYTNVSRSEQKYRELVERINDGITMVDDNEVFTFANSAAEQIFGVQQGQLVGLSLKEFTDIDTFYELCNKTNLRKEGISDTYEMKLIRPNGTERTILCRVSPRFSPDGRFEGTFSAITDVTDLKNYESEILQQKAALSVINTELISVMEELQASNTELTESQLQLQQSLEVIQESERAFKLMFYNSPVMMIATSENGLVTDVNDTWLKYFEFNRPDVIGKPITFNVVSEEPNSVRNAILPQNWGLAQGYSGNVSFVKSNGNAIEASVNSIVTTDIAGRWMGLFSIIDLTPIKQYETEIKRLASFPELNPLYVMEVNSDSSVSYANPTTYQLLQELRITLEQAVALFLPIGVDKIFALYKSSDKSIYHNEVHAQGRVILATAYVAAEFNTIRLFAEDITEQKQVEAALRASESKFEELFRIMPNIIVISSVKDGRYLTVNDEFCRVMNKPREELVGKTAKELNVWADYKERDRILSILNEDGIVLNEEVVFSIGERSAMPALLSMVKVFHQNQECIMSMVNDVSKQKAAEYAIQQSQTQLRQIIDNIPFFIWLKDTEGRHLEVNKYYMEAHKLTREQIIGKTDFDIEPNGLAELYAKQDQDIIRSRQRMALEEPWSDWSDTWYEIFKAPIINQENEVIGITGVARDVSERKKFELRQQLNTARMESILALNQMFDADFADICKFALDEAVRLTNSQIGFLFFIEGRKIDFSRCFWSTEVPELCNIEYPGHYSIDEAGIWVNCVNERRPVICNDYQCCSCSPSKKGQPEGHLELKKFMSAPVFAGDTIIAVAGVGNKPTDYDETDTLQMTLLLNSMWEILQHKQAVESLRASRARLRSLLDSLPHMVWLKDKQGHFIDVNAAFASRKKATIKEMIGKTDYDFFPIDLADRYLIDDQDVINKGARSFVEEKITQDGKNVWFETFKSPIYGPNSEIDGTVGISLDITDRKLAELEQEKFNRELLHTQKLESLGVMAGSIAHNFNNLLVGVLGNAELILQDVTADNSIREGLERIKQAAIKSAEFTNQLLVYSGKGVFEIKPLSLNALIIEMMSLIDVTISKKVKLSLNLSPNLALISGDSIQLNQLIMNLITNAAEAIGNEEGSIFINTGSIDINEDSCSPQVLSYSITPGRYVFLEVIDNGCGMTEEQVRRIFEPFFTTKFTGRGLGLAAVQGVVKSHLGALEVISTLDEGTTFRIFLPVTSDVSQALPFVKNKDHSDSIQGLTVLVVDDEEHVLTVLNRMLTRKNINVILAKDGIEAIEKYSESSVIVDLVILDVTMPRMDGHDTFIELRKLNPSVKVVLTSGFSEKEATEWFIGKGLNGFVQKPFQLETMIEKIVEVVTNDAESDAGQ